MFKMVLTQVIFRFLAIVLGLTGFGSVIASLHGTPSSTQFLGGAAAMLIAFTLGRIADKSATAF